MPNTNQTIEAPYAVRNGVYSVVRSFAVPQGDPERGISEAFTFVGKAHIRRKHPYDGLDVEFYVVIPDGDTPAEQGALDEVAAILGENNIDLIAETNAEVELGRLMAAAY